jgi:hypothetical protein
MITLVQPKQCRVIHVSILLRIVVNIPNEVHQGVQWLKFHTDVAQGTFSRESITGTQKKSTCQVQPQPPSSLPLASLQPRFNLPPTSLQPPSNLPPASLLNMTNKQGIADLDNLIRHLSNTHRSPNNLNNYRSAESFE